MFVILPLLQADVSSFLISVPVTFFCFLVYILLKCFPSYFESTLHLQWDPCESPNSEIVKQMTYLSHALSATLSFYSHFLSQGRGSVDVC